MNRSTTSLAAPPLIFAPAPGVTVPLLTDAQKAFLGLPRAARVAAMADVDARAALAAAGSWPRPVRLEWAPAPSWEGLHARYAVEVRRLPDGTPVFFAETAETAVEVFNLEIARDYEWTVRPTVLGRSAAPAAAAFRTEDRAPRLLRVPGVPNVRDFGGRVGLGGRRVRQGLVFRSAGLNENAAEGFFAREEILARAADPAALLAQEKALLAEAERASALRRAGTAVWLPAPGDLREWTLYRPGEAAFAAGGEAALAAAEAAGTVPASFLGAPGRRVAADAAGRIELPGETMADNRGPAVFLLAFDADRDGFAKVGCGADWFWTLRCNGEVVADHADPDGNHRYPPSADNRVFPVPVRAGRNLLAAVVRAGGSGFVWCCAPRPDAPADKVLAAKAENCERRARYIFHVVSGRTAGASRISGENRALWLETFGVRTDLDLRSEAECWGMEESPLGRSVRWIQVSFAAYQGLQEDWGRAAFARVFPLFLDPASYPLDFHCIGGADRTGSLAFVLGALLGVDEEELWRDWEATAFWDANPDFAHAQRFSRLVASFDAFPGATIRERVESYVRSCGFTDADLETLRALLLD